MDVPVPDSPARTSAPGARVGESAVPVALRRHEQVSRLAANLAHRCEVAAGSPVVIGCSGGSDSVALLLGCVVLRDRGDGPAAVQPSVVHVNHHLRPESGEDQAFVESLCATFGVPCSVVHVDPAAAGGNVSAEARRLRYEALAEAARDRRGVVAVAHQAEDQLETIVMALGRGAGLDGLAAMAWRGPVPLPHPDDTELVRPLLDVTRAECVSLCRAAGVTWRDDPTNRDERRARARIRRDVLPVLEKLWPGAAQRAAGAADTLRTAAAALEVSLQAAFGLPSDRVWRRDDLRALPAPIVAAGLRRALLDALGGTSDELRHRTLMRGADAIVSDDARPRTFGWSRGWRLVVEAREVRLEPGS